MTEQKGPYVITEEMLQIWINKCINPTTHHTDDDFCKVCEYRGQGYRKGCCDFDDECVEKIFRSRPLSSEMLKKENLNVAMVAAYESGMKEGARKEREDVLDQVRDQCAEKMSDKNPSIGGVMLSYILADLRGGEP